MKTLYSLSLLSSLILTPALLAQGVPSEDELFGAGDDTAKDEKTEKPAPKAEPLTSVDYTAALRDTLDIGGRLELRANGNKVDDQRFQESPYFQSKTADVYFDTRPNKDVRAFFRMRFYEDSQRQAQNVDSVTTTENGGPAISSCG